MKSNIKKTALKTSLCTAALGIGFASAANAQGAMIYLDGKPLQSSVPPIQKSGRTLVPMRAIFEALGATVNYNSLTQAIGAQRGDTTVLMSLGSKKAMVNQQPVTLEVPAQTYYNKTMVPLRFVSEALGATVKWDGFQHIASISTGAGGNMAFNPSNNGNNGNNLNGGTQVGGYRQISIPAEAVIPVTLDQAISSANASVGQKFTATVVSAQQGDSEFPAGTRLEGTVVEVQRMTGKEPGVLDLRFRRAFLPDNSAVDMHGQLISLDNDTVTNTNGRITAKGSKGGNSSLKVIGIGAGAGFIVGKLLKKNGLVTGVLGALGGFLYDRSKNKDSAADAKLAAGTRIGVRLTAPVTYRDSTNYYQARSNFVHL